MVFGIIALVEALHSKHLVQLSLTATTAVVWTACSIIPETEFLFSNFSNNKLLLFAKEPLGPLWIADTKASQVLQDYLHFHDVVSSLSLCYFCWGRKRTQKCVSGRQMSFKKKKGFPKTGRQKKKDAKQSSFWRQSLPRRGRERGIRLDLNVFSALVLYGFCGINSHPSAHTLP